MIEGSYNHNASIDPSAYPVYRITTLDSRIVTEIKSLILSGLNNSQILAMIRRSNPSVLLAQKDVSNLVQKTRLQELAGRTPMEWLFQVCKSRIY